MQQGIVNNVKLFLIHEDGFVNMLMVESCFLGHKSPTIGGTQA